MTPSPSTIPELVDAVHQQNRRAAQQFLRGWGLRFQVEHLPAGPVWVVGGYRDSFLAYVPDALHPLWHALIQLEQRPRPWRVMVGRWTFWRHAALELWDAGMPPVCEQRLSGVLEIYHPWVYLVWGRLHLRHQRWVEAGKYFLLSGLYTAQEAVYVERFKQSCQAMSPAQMRTVIPESWQRRWARRVCPDRVFVDLSALPGPAWWQQRLPLIDRAPVTRGGQKAAEDLE